ncbi:ras guanine nucleotide exchange factor G-like isoform X2 [Schistocerca gregaria]|uniref:ras guanine nucleotide exchange factor G-like isoform X2 n=1 Tax=Schistocerca gregaria TaxID=7010 RepID=UPI00211EE081|nr:ras guanine nucleotide exchange factor G-like isoform X2 [Schistocerca gregaria]
MVFQVAMEDEYLFSPNNIFAVEPWLFEPFKYGLKSGKVKQIKSLDDFSGGKSLTLSLSWYFIAFYGNNDTLIGSVSTSNVKLSHGNREGVFEIANSGVSYLVQVTSEEEKSQWIDSICIILQLRKIPQYHPMITYCKDIVARVINLRFISSNLTHHLNRVSAACISMLMAVLIQDPKERQSKVRRVVKDFSRELVNLRDKNQKFESSFYFLEDMAVSIRSLMEIALNEKMDITSFFKGSSSPSPNDGSFGNYISMLNSCPFTENSSDIASFSPGTPYLEDQSVTSLSSLLKTIDMSDAPMKEIYLQKENVIERTKSIRRLLLQGIESLENRDRYLFQMVTAQAHREFTELHEGIKVLGGIFNSNFTAELKSISTDLQNHWADAIQLLVGSFNSDLKDTFVYYIKENVLDICSKIANYETSFENVMATALEYMKNEKEANSVLEFFNSACSDISFKLSLDSNLLRIIQLLQKEVLAPCQKFFHLSSNMNKSQIDNLKQTLLNAKRSLSQIRKEETSNAATRIQKNRNFISNTISIIEEFINNVMSYVEILSGDNNTSFLREFRLSLMRLHEGLLPLLEDANEESSTSFASSSYNRKSQMICGSKNQNDSLDEGSLPRPKWVSKTSKSLGSRYFIRDNISNSFAFLSHNKKSPKLADSINIPKTGSRESPESSSYSSNDTIETRTSSSDGIGISTENNINGDLDTQVYFVPNTALEPLVLPKSASVWQVQEGDIMYITPKSERSGGRVTSAENSLGASRICKCRSESSFITAAASSPDILSRASPLTESRSMSKLMLKSLSKKPTKKEVASEEMPGDSLLYAASINRLIVKLTSETEVDVAFVNCFLATYRSFTTPEELWIKLMERYNVPLPSVQSGLLYEKYNQSKIIPIKLRVVNVIGKWLLSDKCISPTLLKHVEHFINSNVAADFPGLKEKIHEKLKQSMAYKGIQEELSSSIEEERHYVLIGREKFELQEVHVTLEKMQSSEGIVPIHQILLFEESTEAHKIAEQMTLIDWCIYNSIRRLDLLNKSWLSNGASSGSPSSKVGTMIWRFNQVSSWVASNILWQKDIFSRVKVYSKFINVAKCLFDINNFNGAMAIVSGINQSSVYRLRHTASELSKKDKLILNDLMEKLSSKNSFKNCRGIIKASTPPILPYLGMYLTDLTFIEQGNKDIVNGLINFHKRRLVYRVLREIEQYQLTAYNIEQDAKLFPSLLKLTTLKEADLYSLSLIREPQGADRSTIR